MSRYICRIAASSETDTDADFIEMKRATQVSARVSTAFSFLFYSFDEIYAFQMIETLLRVCLRNIDKGMKCFPAIRSEQPVAIFSFAMFST